MMQEENGQSSDPPSIQDQTRESRPLFLSVICVFSFVFYGLITILFLLAFFYSGWIAEVRNKYITDGNESKQMILLITAAGFLLHLVSLMGSIKIWHLKKTGYLMFSISSLVVAIFQLFSIKISFITTAIYISFIILFGIYYRRLQ